MHEASAEKSTGNSLDRFSPSLSTALAVVILSPGHKSPSSWDFREPDVHAGPALRHSALPGLRWGLGTDIL